MSSDAPPPPRSPRHHSHSRPTVDKAPHARAKTSAPSFTPSYAHSFDLANYLQSTFIPSVVPTPEEYEAKEAARQYLEKLAEQVSPGAKLLPFGSMANGFALKNSDMDLCCVLGKDAPLRAPAELVEILGRLIEQETNFQVKMLPRARIPIIKLNIPPTATVPFGMACDIGFENRLALENTRLLLTYAMIDPRLRTMVLFLKVWTKRRKINNPYRGTLSSYGYVLLVIHFLTHVKSPPILPNLQRMHPPRPAHLEDLEFDGNDISFFDDLEALPRIWQTSNQENVGQLLIDFFRYFTKDFMYNQDVVSIRSEKGTVSKDSKGWYTDVDYDPDVIVRDLHKLCIEDPFQLDYNVARTVTRDGLYTIRGEFIRAYRLLGNRPTSDRIASLINDVCDEREDFLVPHPPSLPHPSIDRGNPSPRRRSAPSPRMATTTIPQPAMNDFRIWAALNGVNGGTGLGVRNVDPRAFPRGGPNESALATNGNGGGGLDEAWNPVSPTLGYGSLQPPATHHHSLPRRPPSQQSQQAYAHSQPTSASKASSPPSLERRVSWDGSGTSTGTTQSSSYDLHRFFQNQPGDVPSEPRANLTAPSSPDFGSANYYTSFSDSGYGGPGRSQYRYSGIPDGRAASMGPRHGGSLPRSHHSSMYPPVPIFPEEDREVVAMANSIRFGNFPTPHPHAYPYASSNPPSAYGTIHASPANKSLTTFGLVNEDDEDAEGDARGRKAMQGLSRSEQDDFVEFGMRPRGRSVPHVRMGADGRESILFGEISVVLPRAPDEEVPPVPSLAATLPETTKGVPFEDASEQESMRPRGTTLVSDALAFDKPPPSACPIPTLTTSPPTPVKLSSAASNGVPIPLVPTSPPSIISALSSTRPPAPQANGWAASPPLPPTSSPASPTSPSSLSFAGALRSPVTGPEKQLSNGIAKLRLSDGIEEEKKPREKRKW